MRGVWELRERTEIRLRERTPREKSIQSMYLSMRFNGVWRKIEFWRRRDKKKGRAREKLLKEDKAHFAEEWEEKKEPSGLGYRDNFFVWKETHLVSSTTVSSYKFSSRKQKVLEYKANRFLFTLNCE